MHWEPLVGSFLGSLTRVNFAVPPIKVGKGIEKELAQLRGDLLGDGDSDAQVPL